MSEKKILLIGEYPPPFAGIAVQTKQLYELLVENQIQAYVIPTLQKRTGFFSFINNLRYIRGLVNIGFYYVKIIKIRKFNIIHILSSSGLNFYIFTIPALITSKLFGKKTIIHYHGGSAKAFFKNNPNALKFSDKLTDSLVVPSVFLQNVFDDLGISSNIIPNAISLERFKFINRKEIKPNILSARNLTSTYNISCAIQAFKILHSHFPQAKLTIAGDGPEKSKLISLTKNLNIEESVIFTGNIPNSQMNELYEKSDILINTSNIDNMPVSILEAQAIGLVVVTTNPGGIPFMISDGINGYLSKIKDYEELGNALIRTIEDQDLSLRLIKQGRKDVKNMGREIVYKQWSDLYNQLCD